MYMVWALLPNTWLLALRSSFTRYELIFNKIKTSAAQWHLWQFKSGTATCHWWLPYWKGHKKNTFPSLQKVLPDGAGEALGPPAGKELTWFCSFIRLFINQQSFRSLQCRLENHVASLERCSLLWIWCSRTSSGTSASFQYFNLFLWLHMYLSSSLCWKRKYFDLLGPPSPGFMSVLNLSIAQALCYRHRMSEMKGILEMV